ncbi:MAG: site-2 protease family protein [Bacteroidales bacterium]
MKLKYALKLGRPFGIQVSVHWTFLLIIVWVIFLNAQQGLPIGEIIFSVFFVLAIFVCVVIHELSHSLTARNYGITTKSITLLPIGGVADLEKIPEDPKQELAVSIAGPVSNLVIAFVLWLLINLTGDFNLQPESLQSVNSANFFVVLTFANVMLAVFNLLPVFPMDGGRVFRSLLALKMPRDQATYIAMNIAKFLAVGLGLLGIFFNPFLIIIAIFIFLGAQREYEMIRFSSVLSGYTVKDILITEFTPLHPHDPIQRAVDILLSTPEQRFVVTEENKVKGMLTRNDIIHGLVNHESDEKIYLIMNQDVTCFNANTPLQKAYQTMYTKGITMVPVIDTDNNLIGIIDMETINEFLMIKRVNNKKRV